MLKNTGSQTICFQAVSTTDGSAVTTGTPTVYVLGDGGTQTSGGGTKTHEGQGTWSYVPLASETNYSHVVYTMVLSGAINHAINVYPSTFDYTAALTDSTIADQVWDETQSSHVTAGSFGELATEIADILTDTGTTIPGTITTIDTNVDAILVDTGTTIPATLAGITAAAIADAVWDETQSSHTTGGTFGEIATEINNIHVDTADMQPKLGTPVVSLAADLAAVDVDVNAVLTDTSTTIPGLIPTVNQIADQVWDESQSGHTGAGTFGFYLDSAISGVSTGGVTASEIADAIWDESSSQHVTVGTFGKLAADILTDTGTSIPNSIGNLNDISVAAVADGVWDEATAGHTASGSFGEQVKTDIDSILVETATNLPADIAALSIPSAASVADAVWDETQASHTTAGTFGLYLDAQVSSASTPPTAAAIADAVWDEAQSAHVTAGTFGVIATEIADILTDTGTTLPATLSSLNDVTAASVADAVWDESTTGHTTSGTFGEQVKTDIDAILVDTVTNIPADIAALSIPTSAAIADAVWDETQAGHTTAGTFGLYLDGAVSAAATPPTAAAIADAVWDEAQADHVTVGTFGVVATEIADILTDTGTTIPASITALNDITVAAVVDAVWDEPTSGHTTSGTFGEQVKTDIDAILLDTADMQPRVVSVETDVTAILVDTGTTLDTLVTNIDTNVTAIPGLISALNNISTTQVSTAVWGAAHASYAGAGTFGEQCGVDIDAILADTNELQTDDIPTTLAALNDISVADIWNEAQAGYTTAGTFGDNLDQTVSTAGGGGLTVGGIADAVWDEAMSGHTTTGTAGAVFDSASDLVKTDVIEINSVANAASQLALSAGQIISGTVDTVLNTHTPTVTEFQADDITEATNDHYNSRVLIFTSGSLAGQATAISDYTLVGSTGQFTVVEMTEAPADNDTFIII